MDIESYFRAKKCITNSCNKGLCHEQYTSDCPLHIMNNGIGVRCSVLEQDYSEVAEQIMNESIKLKYPNGYIICISSKEYADIDKCKKYEDCEDCRKGEVK